MELTKDSEKLICTMYKRYLEKRSSGLNKSESNYFGDSHTIHESFSPHEPFDDIDESIWELKRADFISGDYGDNILSDIFITSTGLIFMENRFKNGIKDVLTFLSNFIP